MTLNWTYKLTDKQAYEFDLAPADFSVFIAPNQSFGVANRPVEWYTAEDGKTQILKWSNGDRGTAFNVTVHESTYDGSYNTMTDLRRMLREAIEAEEDPRNNRPVWLMVQHANATNATYHRVKFATVDESEALITQVQDGGGSPVYQARVSLTLYPTGTTERPLLVSTLLANGDFSRWADEDTAYEWDVVSAGTIARASDKTLVGQYSAFVTSVSSADGIETSLVNVPQGHLSIGQVWLHIPDSSTWRVQLLSQPTGEIASVTSITAANLATKAVMTTVKRGVTWGLIQVAQTASVNTDSQVRLRILSDTGTCYVDGALIKGVDTYNVQPNPNIATADNPGPWPDGWAVSGWLEDGDADNHCVAGLDGTNRFWGTYGAVVVFDSMTSAAGYIRSVPLLPDVFNTAFAYRVWVRFETDGATSLLVTLRDGAGNILQSKTITEETIASMGFLSATGADTETWYQVVLTGTNTAAPGYYVQFEPTATGSGTDMQFYFDQAFGFIAGYEDEAAYAQIFAPDLYGGSAGFFGTYVENSPNLNWVRLFNAPGDQPALLKLWTYPTTISLASPPDPAQLWISKYEERLYPEIDQDVEGEAWFESTAANGAWTIPHSFGAGASGEETARFVSSNPNATGSIYYDIRPSQHTWLTGDAVRWASVERRVKVRAKISTAAGATLQFKLSTNGGQTIQSWQAAEELFTANDTWEELDLGPVFFPYLHREAWDYFYAQLRLEIHVYIPDAGDLGVTLHIDYVRFPPATHGGYGLVYFPMFGNPDNWLSLPYDEMIIRPNEGSAAWLVGSGVWQIPPGNIASKLSFSLMDGNNKHTLTDFCALYAAIWPQTTGLLGTV